MHELKLHVNEEKVSLVDTAAQCRYKLHFYLITSKSSFYLRLILIYHNQLPVSTNYTFEWKSGKD